jgi:hypothetical protein
MVLNQKEPKHVAAIYKRYIKLVHYSIILLLSVIILLTIV